MQTTIHLPDLLYRESEQLAAARGATVEQFIVEAVENEVRANLATSTLGQGDREVELPV